MVNNIVYSVQSSGGIHSAIYQLQNPPHNIPRSTLSQDTIFLSMDDQKNKFICNNIAEIRHTDPKTGDICTNRVYEYNDNSSEHLRVGESQTLKKLYAEYDEEELEQESKDRAKLLEKLSERDVSYLEVYYAIQAYDSGINVLNHLKNGNFKRKDYIKEFYSKKL